MYHYSPRHTFTFRTLPAADSPLCRFRAFLPNCLFRSCNLNASVRRLIETSIFAFICSQPIYSNCYSASFITTLTNLFNLKLTFKLLNPNSLIRLSLNFSRFGVSFNFHIEISKSFHSNYSTVLKLSYHISESISSVSLLEF